MSTKYNRYETQGNPRHKVGVRIPRMGKVKMYLVIRISGEQTLEVTKTII